MVCSATVSALRPGVTVTNTFRSLAAAGDWIKESYDANPGNHLEIWLTLNHLPREWIGTDDRGDRAV